MAFSTETETRIAALQQRIAPLRAQIVHHPVYAQMTGMEHLHAFMEHHVFAVWDFMSLLKTLQNALTCTSVPWVPKGSADTRYLINEIVTGEESDLDMEGRRTSHFELYLDAMRQSGADTAAMELFLAELAASGDLHAALRNARVPAHAAAFTTQTFEAIGAGRPHVQSAVFTFGREDLIPSMFNALVADLTAKFPERISVFNYYLERHIEVDGGHHGRLALEMTAALCDTPEKWAEAENAVVASLQSRIHLWNGVSGRIASR